MKESFILYQSFYQPTKGFSAEQKAELYDAMFQYNAGIEVRDLCPVCQVAFSFMKDHFDRNAEKYQSVVNRNRTNGAKRSKSKDNPDEPKKASGLTWNPNNPDEPKKADNGNGNGNGNEKRKVKNIRFSPPTLQEVKEYFLEKGFSLEAGQKAFDYYNEANWIDSTGKQVKNWKQKMIAVWFKPENKQKNTDEPKKSATQRCER